MGFGAREGIVLAQCPDERLAIAAVRSISGRIGRASTVRKWYITRLFVFGGWNARSEIAGWMFGRAAAVAFAAALASAAVVWPPSATAAADPGKVLRVAFEVEETGFDPVKVTDNYSSQIIENVFERLLTYDYLARPGEARRRRRRRRCRKCRRTRRRSYSGCARASTTRPDPAFKGARREMVAQDVAYSIKRLVDPANRSPWRFLVDGKIVGLDAVAKAAAKSNKFDYDANSRRARDRRQVHAARPPHRHRLQLRVHHGDAGAVDRRTRGHRCLSRRHQRASGRHRALHPQELDPQGQDDPRGQSGLPRCRLGLRRGRSGAATIR